MSKPEATNNLPENRSIQESTAIIKSNEKLVGQGLYNIGQELKYIRNNRTYKEAGYSSFKCYVEGELGYSSRHARNFIKISEKYNRKSISVIGNTGVTKLLELAKIGDEEERQKFIEDNDVEDMTTRELKKEIKARKQAEKEKEQAEKKLQQERQQKQELKQRLQQEKAKPPEVKEKEVIPDDYKQMKKQNRKLKSKLRKKEAKLDQLSTELDKLEKEKQNIEKQAELNEQEAKEYQQLKTKIRNLKEEKNSIHRQFEAVTSISDFVSDIERFLQDELAPVKYSRALQEASDDEIVVENVREIVNQVRSWCEEIESMLPNDEYKNVEVIE